MFTSNTIQKSVIGLAVCVFALSACATSKPPVMTNDVTFDGLYRVENTRLDQVYRKKDLNLGKYSKVMLRDLEIAYKADRGEYELDEGDKARLQRIFRESAEKELVERGGYELVDEPGPNVLRVDAAVIDLTVNAPDDIGSRPGRSRTFVMRTGDITILGELRDSQSDEILVRFADKKQSREQFRQMTTVSAWSDVRMIFSSWARILRDGLDNVRN